MNKPQTAAFDKVASDYDSLWSNTAVGRNQRQASWDLIDPLFNKGDLVLDLGCGTGLDAAHLQTRGVHVYAIDASSKMVEIARQRGVDAHHLRLEDLHSLSGMRFDGVLSNFGALNCVESLQVISSVLGPLIRPGGHMALNLLGRHCLWEVSYYLLRGNAGRAFRRFHGRAASSFGTHVFYPSTRSVSRAFGSSFRLLRYSGIGLCVPPSYVTAPGSHGIDWLAAVDRRLAHQRVLRSLADHALYIFKRL